MAVSSNLDTVNCKKGISIIIPAYNEKNRIKSTLDKYLPVIESFNLPYEIIVVIDGQDGTENVIKDYTNLKYYKSAYRLGKGGAVKKGLSMAQFEYVGYLDADGSLDIKGLMELLRQIQTNCCVIASRYMRESRWINKQTMFRRLASRGFNFIANLVLHLKVKDSQCGAKFFRINVIAKILPQLEVTNWAFDVSILYHIKKEGYTIKEIPISWNHNEYSKISAIAAIVPMLFTVLGVKLMNSRIKDYVPEFLFKIISKFRVY